MKQRGNGEEIIFEKFKRNATIWNGTTLKCTMSPLQMALHNLFILKNNNQTINFIIN